MTILVVEDEEIILAGLARFLGRQGHCVIACASFAAALASSAEDMHVDLLLADLHLPDGNGAELAHRISMLRPDIRVVILTGDEGAAVHSMHVVAKPLNRAALMKAISEARPISIASTRSR